MGAADHVLLHRSDGAHRSLRVFDMPATFGRLRCRQRCLPAPPRRRGSHSLLQSGAGVTRRVNQCSLRRSRSASPVPSTDTPAQREYLIDGETAIVGPHDSHVSRPRVTGSSPIMGCGAVRRRRRGSGRMEVRASCGTRSPRCSMACHDDGHHWSSGSRDHVRSTTGERFVAELLESGPLPELPRAGALLTCRSVGSFPRRPRCGTARVTSGLRTASRLDDAEGGTEDRARSCLVRGERDQRALSRRAGRRRLSERRRRAPPSRGRTTTR